MKKLVLTPDVQTPKVRCATGPVFNSARGGPYKYGVPIYFNAEAAKRLRERTL
jgi:hypothetical protein